MSTQAAGTEDEARAVVQVDVAALYNDHADKLRSGALSVLAPNNMADRVFDAVNTVIANLQTMHSKGILTARDWKPYLYKAARNAALRIVAEQQETVSLDQLSEDGLLHEKAHSRQSNDPVADEVIKQQNTHRFWNALHQLGLDERSLHIITGALLDDLTDAELGRELGITGQRVGVIRRSALRKLTEALLGGDNR